MKSRETPTKKKNLKITVCLASRCASANLTNLTWESFEKHGESGGYGRGNKRRKIEEHSEAGRSVNSG